MYKSDRLKDIWELEKDPLAFIQPNSPRPEENLGDDIDLSGETGTDVTTEIKTEAENLFALSKHQVDLKELDDKSVPDLKSSETEKSDSVHAVQHLPLDAKLLPIPAIVAESSLNEGRQNSYAPKIKRPRKFRHNVIYSDKKFELKAHKNLHKLM